MINSPSISKIAFWDISFENLDFQKFSLFVMEKVFNHGTWNDQLEIMRFYGLDRIRWEIINASYLKKTVLSFLSVILHLPKTDFKCYKRMQLNPLPWRS